MVEDRGCVRQGLETVPGHLGPRQSPVQPEEQDLPGVSAGGATSCLAAIHSVILGMMGPLKPGVRSHTDRMTAPDTVLAARELPVAVPEEDALPVLLLALLEVGEGGAAWSGIAELLALVRTFAAEHQSVLH